MLTFKESILIENASYEDYEKSIDFYLEAGTLSESAFDTVKGKITGAFGKVFRAIKFELEQINQAAKLSVEDILNALKSKNVFTVLKAFGFSIVRLMGAALDATGILRKGLDGALQAVHNEKLVEKVQSGAMTLDEVLDRFPILKKLTGSIISVFLIFGWLNMTFLGAFKSDFDVKDWFKAPLGKFTIKDLFASKNGAAFFALLAVGLGSGGALSVAWLGESVYNVALALTYIGSSELKNSDFVQNKLKALLSKIKK